MSKLKASNELPTYFVPKSVYDEVMNEIQRKVEINDQKAKYHATQTAHCHQTSYKYFNTHQPALSSSNLLEAARQAFEDRNFRVLYEVIYKGLDRRDFHISIQLFEYLCAAIEIDPKIQNKEQTLHDAVKGFKDFENDKQTQKFIQKAHKLIKAKKGKELENSSDSDNCIEVSSSEE